MFEADPRSSREERYHDVEIEEECNPGGRLVLRYRRDDGNVNLSVPEYMGNVLVA